MKISMMFGLRAEDEGPEAIEFVWDEFCIEANPEAYEAAVKEAEAKAKKDGFIRTKVITVKVDGASVYKLLTEDPQIPGTIEA